MSRYSGCTVFVGNLPGDVREREVEDLFYKYGRILDVGLKTPLRPPAYAFVDFEDPRDAQDAVAGRDNYDFHGTRLRVEISRGRGGPPPPGPSYGGGGHGGGGYGGGSGYGGGGYSGRSGGHGGGSVADVLDRSRSKGSKYRVLVKGLPSSASWQDLKDHFRKVVKPSYVNVVPDRGGALGVVEFDTSEDMERAIRKLDDTEFRNPFDRGYIRIVEDDGDRSRRRSRSRSSSRRRSYSRSSRSRSRSRDSRIRSRSPKKSRSRSASKSKSRSRSASKSKSRSPSAARSGGSPAKDDMDDKSKGDRSPSS